MTCPDGANLYSPYDCVCNRPIRRAAAANFRSVMNNVIAILLTISVAFVARANVSFTTQAESIAIQVDSKPFATYVWSDPGIPRPYFCNVHAPNGVQVTRSYPIDPVINKGNDDHDTFHPGLWLAFGDVNELDVWRNKARVWHAQFVEKPSLDGDHGTFTVLNVYDPPDGTGDASFYETCRYDIYELDMGWFILSQSAFQSRKGDIRFGDQEEMGFGVRLQTPLTVKFGNGTILNSEKGRNEFGTWGFQAKWCSAFGKADERFAGVTLMPGPKNFRPSWFHSRDYGLVVANPFGKKAMTAADRADVPPDVTVVPKGDALRLTFGAFFFATHDEPDNGTAFEWFTELLSQCDAPQTPMEFLQDLQSVSSVDAPIRSKDVDPGADIVR